MATTPVADKDLVAIQEARALVKRAREAQKTLAGFTQEQVDKVVEAMAGAAKAEAERLARMAHEETGFGNTKDKTLKNLFSAVDVYNYIRPKGITMLGPNCPGALSPGKANVGIIPAEVLAEGRIGLVSRSGTLTYQIGYELAQMGLGNSTIVGIGGDPVVGSSFIDILGKFEADPETEVVVMVGEIGGDEEEKAAQYIAAEMSKPVVAYIAGFTAPPGKTMGHAGAIISGSSGTAQAKKEALEAAGVKVGTTPTEVAELAAETAGATA